MFFGKIEKYSNGKLRTLYYSSLLLYFVFTLVSPIVVISQKYALFTTAASTTMSLTGIGACILLAFSVIGVKKLKEQINKFPENTVAQRRIKFTCELVYSLAIPVVVVAVLIAFKLDFIRAYDTIRDCIIFYIIGILIDNLFVKYLASERSLRFESQKDVEKQKRMALFQPKEKKN